MDVLGHKKQIEVLKKVVGTKKIPHSILFSGPEAVGKKRVALEFCKFINAQKEKLENDLIKKSIDKRNYSDLILIEKDEEIGIDDVRDLQQKISFKSKSKDSYKVAIIDNAELLNFEAQSALLKTLEEPTGNNVIILITEHPNSLMKTILSRIWRVDFSEVDPFLVKGYLLENGLNEKEAEDLVQLSFSRPGWAIRLMEDSSFKKKLIKQKKEFEDLQKMVLSERFGYIKKVSTEDKDIMELLKYWSLFLRQKIRTSKDKEEIFKLIKVLELIQKNFFLVSKTNINSKVSLEKILINL